MDFERPSRAAVKQWGKLLQGKYRQREGMFIAEGRKVVCELLRSNWRPAALFLEEGKEDDWKLPAASRPGGVKEEIKTYVLTPEEWRRLSQDRESEGIMALVRLGRQPEWLDLLHHGAGNILLLDRINNPNNLGAILRTAHWFGFSTVLLSAAAVDWTHPKTVRSSMGSVFHLALAAGLDFRVLLPEVRRCCLLIGSDVRDGVPPHHPGRRTALLLGSESHGLPEDYLENVDERWHIPGAGEAESLSVPQAAAIMMYEISGGGSKP